MVIGGRMKVRKLPVYLFAQFSGAFLAGLTIYLLFSSSISVYENVHGIIRGSTASMQTAKIFGEYYSGVGGPAIVSMPLAFGAETLGTFLLLLMIFALTEGCNIGRPDNAIAPLFIGLTVSSIICLIAPLTQAGLNPARDFGPRMVSLLAGWKGAAFPDKTGGFFFVYILGPVIGGIFASLFFVKILEPAMRQSSDPCNCIEEKSIKGK